MAELNLALEGIGNPYKDACVEARDVVIEQGALRARRADQRVDNLSGTALALRGETLVAESNASKGLSYGDMAIFLPNWHVHTRSGVHTLSEIPPPTVLLAEPHYPHLLTPLNWTLVGATTGINRVPNHNFQNGSAGWQTISGTVLYGWTGHLYAAWIRGAGSPNPPYPYYAGFRSQPFAIDRTKSYTFQLTTICEPYHRYTYDNNPPRFYVRLWQYNSAGQPIGTDPLIIHESDQAHPTGRRGVWHRHHIFIGIIAPAGSGEAPAWHPNAAQAVIEIYCNLNKQRFTDIQLIEGGQAQWRVEGNRRIGRWELQAVPEVTEADVFVKGNFNLTNVYSLRFDYVRIRGAESIQDDALVLTLEDEDGEWHRGRILSYRHKEAIPGTMQTVVYEDVEFDTTMVRGQTVRHIGLETLIQASSQEHPIIEIGSPIVSLEDDTPQFALYKHGGIPRGTASFLLTEMQTLDPQLKWESRPAELKVDLNLFNYHNVRVNARSNRNGALRLYRLVADNYYLSASRNNDGDLIDEGQVGEPYRTGGLLPEADVGATFANRLVVGKTGTRTLFVSGQNEPLRFSETAYRDEDAFTLILPENIRAITTSNDSLLVYTQTRLYRLTRYIPLVLLEEYALQPDHDRVAHRGAIISREQVVLNGQLLKQLPNGFTAGLLRMGQDGTLFIAHANEPLAYLLTPEGWTRWTLPIIARDALMINGYWYIVNETGCYQLASDSRRVLQARWVSGYFADEGKSRPVWLWLRGEAMVSYNDFAGNSKTKSLQDERWQIPAPQTARAWQIQLELSGEQTVYAVHLLAQQADVK